MSFALFAICRYPSQDGRVFWAVCTRDREPILIGPSYTWARRAVMP